MIYFLKNGKTSENLIKTFSTEKSSALSTTEDINSEWSLKFYEVFNIQREIVTNEPSKKGFCCSRHTLFLCPLILCIMLLVSGVFIFIFIEKRNDRITSQNETESKLPNVFNSTESFSFDLLSCSFDNNFICNDGEFILNELKCGLNRSSLFRVRYLNSFSPLKPGDNLSSDSISIPPKVTYNINIFFQIKSTSFMLILIDPEFIRVACMTYVHWIQFISSKSDDEFDICSYKIDLTAITNVKVFLLYATNSSKTMIIAKTICDRFPLHLQLQDYVKHMKLKLVASTYFSVPYRRINYDENDNDR